MVAPHKFSFENESGTVFGVSIENKNIRTKIDFALYEFLRRPENSKFRLNSEMRASLALALYGEDSVKAQKRAGNQIEKFS